MQSEKRAIAKATLALEESLDALDDAIREQGAVQHRIDTLTKRMNPLLKILGNRFDRESIRKLSALCLQQLALQQSQGKASKGYAKAKQAYGRAQVNYRSVSEAHNAMLNELQAHLSAHARREAALSRTVLFLMDLLKADLPNAPAAASFELPAESHDYIPIDVALFLDMLMAVDRLLTLDPAYACEKARYRPVSFLEVGCGSGRNIVLARVSRLCLWRALSGFDINESEIELGQKAFGLEKELFVADAMDFDYGAYDVIFSYRPLRDLQMQTRLEARMVRTMHADAYLLAPLPVDLSLYPELAKQDATLEIWKKLG